MIRALEQADRRAADSHGWDEFRPFGLIIYRDYSSEAVLVTGPPDITLDDITKPERYREPSVRDVAVATGRAMRAAPGGVLALGVVCAAWASRRAVAELGTPATAPDRQRARIIYAADEGRIAHVFSNVAGVAHYEFTHAETDTGIAGFLAGVLAEANFATRFLCSSGLHEQPPIL